MVIAGGELELGTVGMAVLVVGAVVQIARMTKR
jgi:hypothetical protein